MEFLIVIIVLALELWIIGSIGRWLWRSGKNKRWWIGFGCLVAAGICLGGWASSLEYQVSPGMRWQGFPVPLSFFVWEEDRRTDLIPAEAVQGGGFLADLLSGVVICLVPLIVLRLIQQRGFPANDPK